MPRCPYPIYNVQKCIHLCWRQLESNERNNKQTIDLLICFKLIWAYVRNEPNKIVCVYPRYTYMIVCACVSDDVWMCNNKITSISISFSFVVSIRLVLFFFLTSHTIECVKWRNTLQIVCMCVWVCILNQIDSLIASTDRHFNSSLLSHGISHMHSPMNIQTAQMVVWLNLLLTYKCSICKTLLDGILFW